MTTSISITAARAQLPLILERVNAGEEVTLTRHGEPVAVVVRPDRLRTRRADSAFGEAERVADLLASARSRKLRKRPILSTQRADEMVADVYAGRSSR
jgi:prevent-host-death family protein